MDHTEKWRAYSQHAHERAERARLESASEDDAGDEWTLASWVQSLRLHRIIGSVLEMHHGASGHASGSPHTPFEFAKSLDKSAIASILDGAGISHLLAHYIAEGSATLCRQAAPSGRSLNSKYVESGDAKFDMCFGGLEVFYAGLQRLIGSPLFLKDGDETPTLLSSMLKEHCESRDRHVQFHSSNSIGPTWSELEWEFVHQPDVGKQYPQSTAMATVKRTPQPLENFLELMECANGVNQVLRGLQHDPLIKEEVVSARLYSGPMYEK